MFGEKIAKLRKQQKLTQYELADILGFSRGQLANYEQGTREPDFKTLEIITNYFEVSTDFLLGIKYNEVNQPNEAKEFEAFANDPELQQWYKELPTCKAEDLHRLRKVWDIIKNNEK